MRIFLVVLVVLGLSGCADLHEGVNDIEAQFNRGLSGGGQIIPVEPGPPH